MVAAVGMYYMSQEPAWVLLAGLALLPLTLQLGLLDSPCDCRTIAQAFCYLDQQYEHQPAHMGLR